MNNLKKRLTIAITSLFVAYDKEIGEDILRIWLKGLLPFGKHACEAVEAAVYGNEQFMPRVGQIRADAEKRAGLRVDPDELWPETFRAMREWNAGAIEYSTHISRPPIPKLPPAAAFAVDAIGRKRFDMTANSDKVSWLRKEFDRAIAAYNEKPTEERVALAETKQKRLERHSDTGGGDFMSMEELSTKARELVDSL